MQVLIFIFYSFSQIFPLLYFLYLHFFHVFLKKNITLSFYGEKMELQKNFLRVKMDADAREKCKESKVRD